jgi:hypothetical protein
MKYTRDEIIKRITNELDECLSSINGEIYDYSEKILDLDLKKQTITIKFDFNVQEDDDYVGLVFY